ncbi:hypothetical protein Y032_0092g2572 [Ancylostoma ceylanicum]|uniref:Uncharacterized protein n=1 Tax=Ancylostoma ceylanicum TaxID=53326 RepID=A0A016TM15_9BILA|nr:hypothetical protein Y032_0092g2572 [Ancylostoma ceylanicum]
MGTVFLDHAEAADLAVVNTLFKKKNEHLITYCSGGCATQIDYILVRRKDGVQRGESRSKEGSCNCKSGAISSLVSVLGPVPRIEEEEVTDAIARIKNGKSPGPDNLPSEVWRTAQGAGTLHAVRLLTEKHM